MPSYRYFKVTSENQSALSPNTHEIEPLETFTDTIRNITFKYPKELSTQYIHPVEWPPKITSTSGSVLCDVSGKETQLGGQTRRILINEKDYCVTTTTEGAAGSTYTRYIYKIGKINKTVVMTFVLRSTECANYDDPQKTECFNERRTFDVNTIADKIMSTISL